MREAFEDLVDGLGPDERSRIAFHCSIQVWMSFSQSRGLSDTGVMRVDRLAPAHSLAAIRVLAFGALVTVGDGVRVLSARGRLLADLNATSACWCRSSVVPRLGHTGG